MRIDVDPRGFFRIDGIDEGKREAAEEDFGFLPIPREKGAFYTKSAPRVSPFYDAATDAAKRIIYPFALNYFNSFASEPIANVFGVGGAEPARPPCIAPGANPYRYQWGGVQLAQSRRNMLIGDEAGLGKSLTSISIFNDQRFYPRNPKPGQDFICRAGELRVLIGCPAFLVDNWVEEVYKWFRSESLPIVAMNKPKPTLTRAGFYIVPYSRIDKQLDLLRSTGRFHGLILDEVHYLKSDMTVKRAEAVFGSFPARAGIVHDCDRVFPLSGTPVPNNPGEMYNLLSTLAPEVIGRRTRYDFESEYMMQDAGGRYTGARLESALNAELRGSGFMMRRAKRDVLDQLPEKVISLLPMPVKGDVSLLVAEEVKLFELAQMRPTRTAQELADLVGHIMRVRKQLAIAKAPMIAEYVKLQLATNEREKRRLVLFMLHTEAIDDVARRCYESGIRVFVVDGRVSTRRRHEMKKEFQAPGGPPTLFLGQTRAAGVGLTLTAARRVGLGELSWSFAENSQAMDRVHRISQTDVVSVDVLTFPHAVESRVIASQAKREISAGRILDERLNAAILSAEAALAPDLVDTWEDA